MEYYNEIINGILFIFCIYLLVRVRENTSTSKGNEHHIKYLLRDKVVRPDINSSVKELNHKIDNVISELGLDSRNRHGGSFICAEAGEKYRMNIRDIARGISNPYIEHLILTSPELFLKMHSPRTVEITRATSAGEQTVKGYLAMVDVDDRKEMAFEVSNKGGVTRIKHSEIINFKFTNQ